MGGNDGRDSRGSRRGRAAWRDEETRRERAFLEETWLALMLRAMGCERAARRAGDRNTETAVASMRRRAWRQLPSARRAGDPQVLRACADEWQHDISTISVLEDDLLLRRA